MRNIKTMVTDIPVFACHVSWNLKKKDSWWYDCLDVIGGSINPYNLFRSSPAVCIKKLNMFIFFDSAVLVRRMYPVVKSQIQEMFCA